MSTIAVIGGGANPEHDVSLRSSAAVAEGLDRIGHDVIRFTIRRDGIWEDDGGALGLGVAASLSGAVGALQQVDLVFAVLHGEHGEDGALAALCELAGLPYVGCGVRAGALGMDKHATKLYAQSLGVAVSPGALVLPGAPLPGTSFPAVVKPRAAGSSNGVHLVHDDAELATAVSDAMRYGDAVLVEQFIRAREIHVGVLQGPDGALTTTPLIEFEVADGTIFDTSRKYDGTTAVHLPARIPDAIAEAIRGDAIKLFNALGCAGLCRFDFFVTADDRVLLNEINTMPGMTALSGYPRMVAAGGRSFDALLETLVDTALTSTGARS